MDLVSLFLLIFLLCASFFVGLSIYSMVQLSRHGRFSHPKSLQAVMQMGTTSMLYKAQLDLNSLTFATHPWIILAFFVFLFIQAINAFYSFRKDRKNNIIFRFALSSLELCYPELPREEHQKRANKVTDQFEKDGMRIIVDFLRDLNADLGRQLDPIADGA